MGGKSLGKIEIEPVRHFRSFFFLLLALVLLVGCQSNSGTGGGFLQNLPFIGGLFTPKEVPEDADPIATALWPLSSVGGLCLLTGVVMLVVTKFESGRVPAALGVGLIVLNAILSAVLNEKWFLIGVAATGAVSLVVAAFNGKVLFRRWKVHQWKLKRSPSGSRSDGPDSAVDSLVSSSATS